jgi:hypothetical protein
LVPKLQSLPAKDKAVLLSQHNDADVAQLSDAELAKLVPQVRRSHIRISTSSPSNKKDLHIITV